MARPGDDLERVFGGLGAMGGNIRPKLSLVRGGKSKAQNGTLRITVGSTQASPAVDARVAEEDSWLILSAGPEVTEPAEHPIRLFTELLAAEPVVPGTVLVRDRDIPTLLAVVHDFGVEPCCRDEWITTALRNILAICQDREIGSLLLPLFGVHHGGRKPDGIVPLIIRALREAAPPCLTTVFLAVPPGQDVADVLSRVREAGGQELPGLRSVETIGAGGVSGLHDGDDGTPET